MYTTPQSGQVAPGSAAPTLHLGTYRRAIMAVLADDVFTQAERLRANHAVYESQDSARLALWLTNVTRVRDEREATSNAKLETALERGRKLVMASELPATGGQLNDLKMAAWRLRFASEADRHQVLDVIISGLLNKPQAAALLARLEAAVVEQQQAATPSQCDEVFAVACHPALLACEKSQALGKLPTLTYAGAVHLLGKLYAKVLHRTGQRLGHNDGSTQLAAA